MIIRWTFRPLHALTLFILFTRIAMHTLTPAPPYHLLAPLANMSLTASSLKSPLTQHTRSPNTLENLQAVTRPSFKAHQKGN
jgi:hypothetical protein